MFERDPAARSRLEVLLCYPGRACPRCSTAPRTRCGGAAGCSPARLVSQRRPLAHRHRDPSRRHDRPALLHRSRHGRRDRRDGRDRRRRHALPGRHAGRRQPRPGQAPPDARGRCRRRRRRGRARPLHGRRRRAHRLQRRGLKDVPAGVTMVGIPAQPVGPQPVATRQPASPPTATWPGVAADPGEPRAGTRLRPDRASWSSGWTSSSASATRASRQAPPDRHGRLTGAVIRPALPPAPAYLDYNATAPLRPRGARGDDRVPGRRRQPVLGARRRPAGARAARAGAGGGRRPRRRDALRGRLHERRHRGQRPGAAAAWPVPRLVSAPSSMPRCSKPCPTPCRCRSTGPARRSRPPWRGSLARASARASSRSCSPTTRPA